MSFRRVGILLFCLLALPVLPAASQQKAPVVSSTATPAAGADEIVITAEGMAALREDPVAAEEEALWDAKRNAVEQAVGVFIHSQTIGRDAVVETDEVRGRVEGFIRRWELISDSKRISLSPAGGQILKLKIRATVSLLPLLKQLSDMQDLYKDLERPRLRITTLSPGSEEAGQAVQTAITTALTERGFELATTGSAEVELTLRLTIRPTIRLGQDDSPYGVGESMAACRAGLTLRVDSTASEETLMELRSEGSGQSFQSDREAGVEAARNAADQLVQSIEQDLVQRLLARWAHERLEGHSILLKTHGLKGPQRADLRTRLQEMRGFLHIDDDRVSGPDWTVRFQTRQDTRAIRSRLKGLRLTGGVPLQLESQRGPIILCSVVAEKRPRKSAASRPRGGSISGVVLRRKS